MSTGDFAKVEKIPINQQFRTTDFFAVLGSLLVILSVIGPILRNHVESEAIITAAQDSHLHAQSLREKLVESKRAPASSIDKVQLEGVVGRDPWGEPYSYKVLRNVYGQPTHVLVWSKGPNLVSDTNERVLVRGLDQSSSEVSFDGDDLGSTYSLAQ